MSLNEARDRFESEPTAVHAEQYYRVAREYHDDGMISDATFLFIADLTAELRGE